MNRYYLRYEEVFYLLAHTTAYTITTSPKGKTKQPTNTVHVRPVLPNTPPTVPPVAPPETPNIPEKPNLPNSPRIPQVPKVPNQPMIPRKPTLSLTSSRLKIPEPLKYVPVGKILPHTGDNSDKSCYRPCRVGRD